MDQLKKLNLLIFLLICNWLISQPIMAHSKPIDNIIIPLVKYYVVADGKTAGFLREYCNKTEIKTETISNGRIKAGPFLSGYEANWLTGLTANANTIREDDFIAKNIDNLDIRKIIHSDSDKISGKVWFFLTPFFKHTIVKNEVSDKEQPVYYLSSKEYLLEIATHPWVDFYQGSFGLALIDSFNSPIFIQINGGGRGSGYKHEIYRIWYFDTERRVQIPLYEFDASEFVGFENDVTFTSTRLLVNKNSLKVKYYHLTGNIRRARDDGSIKSGTDESNSDINILDKIRIKKGEDKTYSIARAVIKGKNENYAEKMNILPESVQIVLEGKASFSFVPFTDILSAIEDYWAFLMNRPETIEETSLDKLILEFCGSNNCQNNVQIRQALLSNIKDAIPSFVAYTQFMILLFKISKLPGGTISIPNLNSSFTFTDHSGTFEGIFDWNADSELIKHISYEWWDAHWPK